jgi:TRAP-type C4-dicarboxylate transport system substrate-binding protein
MEVSYMLKRVFCVCLVLVMVVCGGSSAFAASRPITIRLQGAFGEASDHYFYLPQFIASVYTRSGGTVRVVWGSGPEAIPTTELADAMISGIVELVYVPVMLLTTHVPGLRGHTLTDPVVMRRSGGVEFVNSVTMEALNSRFLARTQNGSFFVLGIGSDVNSVSELRGMILRSTIANRALVASVGAEMVNIGWADVYQALERNVIHGLAGAPRDFVDNSLGGIVRTLIMPGVFTSDASLLIGNHVWDRLDDVQREAILSSAIDWEDESLRYNRRMIGEQLALLEAAGTRILELTGAERDEYVRRAYETGWAEAEAGSPEMARQLREFSPPR